MRQLFTILSTCLTLAAAGCSAAPAPPGAPASSVAVPTAPAPATTAAPAQPTTGPTTEASVQPALASRTASLDGGEVRIDVRELRVTGELTLLTWSVTNTSRQSLRVDGFGDHLYATDPVTKERVPSELSGPVDGVYLLDAVNKKRYLNARDAHGGCVCSFTAGVTLKAGETVLLQNVFQSVPPGVAKVTVVIPRAGSFGDLPVSR